jgi:hypothetical protein
LRLEIDVLRRVLAAIVYAAGACVVLYVAYFLPYINPEDTCSTIAIDHWGLLVSGIGWIFVASVLWTVRFSSEGFHNDERPGDENA